MGFSGKPSKGCAPCRAKRTKCDLALPSCTQCVRKNRVCSGYRNEQDLLFRNETKLVERKAKRKSDEQWEQRASPDRFALQLMTAQQPSRIASVDDEAILHFFAHYNEKFFAAEGQQHPAGGFDFVMPVFQQDAISGGPIPEIVRASGLAALGNMKGSPDLLVAARAKQVKVLRHLNQQLQNPQKALSDSSILTCIMLGVFENIICDSPQSTLAMTYHLRGASTLAELRGPAQFTDDVGHGIYARMRGFILAHCLQTRDPLPEFIMAFLDDEGISQRDFEPAFYKLLARLCQVRADQKNKGFVDADMAKEAQSLMADFEMWQPSISDWNPDERPAPSLGAKQKADETYRFVWLATIWIFKHTARILASDIVIEWARAQLLVSPGSPTSSTLDEAIDTQKKLCEELKDSTGYYLENFRDAQSAMRTVGGYGLLWPLYVLSTTSTSTPETMVWIGKQSEKIAEGFGVRQGKAMAEFMKMYTTHAL